MKSKLITIIMVLLLAGCMSNKPRKWFGSNTVGENLDTARTSTEAIINQEQAIRHQKEVKAKNEVTYAHAAEIKKLNQEVDSIICKEAPQIRESTLVKTSEIEDESTKIQEIAIEQQELLIKINTLQRKNVELLEQVNSQAQGKTYRSKTKIFIYWIAGISFVIMLFGIACRTLPFFSPINRAISGIMNAIMDIISGQYDAIKNANLTHLEKTKTIKTEDLSKEVQLAIIKNKE